MTAPITDYSVEAQPAAEDLANALVMLSDVDTRTPEGQMSLDRACALVMRAFKKLSA